MHALQLPPGREGGHRYQRARYGERDASCGGMVPPHEQATDHETDG